MVLAPDVAQLKEQNKTIVKELLALIALRKRGSLDDRELEQRRAKLLTEAAPTKVSSWRTSMIASLRANSTQRHSQLLTPRCPLSRR